MQLSSQNATIRYARRVFNAALFGLAIAASGSALAGKPTSYPTLLVDAPLGNSGAGYILDLDTGEYCITNSPPGNLCGDGELVFYFLENSGVLSYGSPLHASGFVRVAVLRGIPFHQVDQNLADSVNVKFTRDWHEGIKFTDTMLVQADGKLFKVGFIECHSYQPLGGYQNDLCVPTNVGDTEDDGGPGGDEGMRMSVARLY